MNRTDRTMLAVSIAAGLGSTLRMFGTGHVSAGSSVLLAVSAILAVRPSISAIRSLSARGRAAPALGIVFAAHLIATLFFFPPEDILDSRPVITLDHAIHYQQAVRAAEVFPQSLRLDAYDPYFMAGYPAGTVFDIDSKAMELWTAVLQFMGTARAYKAFILLGYLLLPFTVYAGSRRLGFDIRESLLSLLVLLLFWHWGRPYIGEFRFAGMFSCLFVSHLSIYVIGLFRSILRNEEARLFWISGPLAFLVHPTAAVLLPVPFLALFIRERRAVPAGPGHRRWESRLLMKLLLWCVLVITVNLVWLVPFFRYLDIKTASETFFQVRGIRELAGILLKAGNLPAVGLILVSATGALRLIRSGRGGTAAAPLAGSLFLFVIAAFGTYIPLFDQMEPGRFLMPALIMISPMAGSGLTALYGFAARRVSNRKALAVAARTAVVTLLILSPVSSLLASRSWYRYTLSTTFTPEVEELVGALRHKTDTSGRVMIEDGPAWNFGESFLPAILPGLTGVQQIGGPYPWAFIRHNFTNFHMCEAMGKGLASMPEEEFWGYMRLYDVRWIVTTTSGCREVVLGILGDDPAWESRHFSLWEIDPRGPSLLDQGVIVTAGYDRIEVTVEGSREGQVPARISLPYHWDRGLRVAEPAVIMPEQRMDDPVPFIVLEPHGETSIQIEYRP